MMQPAPGVLAGMRSCNRKQPRRRGRWIYSDRNGQYGYAGWWLTGSPLVLDFMPGAAGCEPGRGLYLLYNWPGGLRAYDRAISRWCRTAMDEVEAAWDEYRAMPCSRCSRTWDQHHEAADPETQAVWDWMAGCRVHIFPAMARMSPRLAALMR